MEREELADAAAELFSESWIPHRRIDEATKAEWLEQVSRLLEDVLSHTDCWCVLPTATSDRVPPDVEFLGPTLGFLDSAALYRVLPLITKGHLLLRTERISFESFRHVRLSDSRYHGSEPERHWQFLTEGDAFNQGASEGLPRTREFLRELARRLGWPLPIS